MLMTVIPSKRAARVDINLSLCLPDLSTQQRQKLGKAALVNLGRTMLETPHLWFGPEQTVKKLLGDVEQLSLFEAAQAEARKKNTGVVVLAPHLNWEAAVLFIGLLGPSSFLYKPQKPSVEPLVRAGRGRFGTHFVKAVPGNVREQLEARLAKGDTLLMLPDQDPPKGRGVFAPFFNVSAHTPSIVGRVLQNNHAPLLLLHVERKPDGQGFRACFLPAPEGIDNADKIPSATAVNEAMEICIRRSLAQYMWNVPRFRRQPDGKPNPYK